MERVHLSAMVSSLHLLALALGVTGIYLRSRALRAPLDRPGLDRVLNADTAWGLAALLWIGSGLARAFGGLEQGSDYYLSSPLFWVKMGLLIAILALELRPMLTFIRWRRTLGQGALPDTSGAARLATISTLQLGLVILMVFVASLMARGVGR